MYNMQGATSQSQNNLGDYQSISNLSHYDDKQNF